MKRLTLSALALLSLILVCATSVRAEDNVLPGGDMEDGITEWGTMNQALPTKDSHDGGQALELRAENQENVRATKGLTTPVSNGMIKLWYRCPDQNSAASNLVVALIPMDSLGTEISNARQTFTVDKPNDGEWHEFVSEFHLPADAKSALLRLSVNEPDVVDSEKGRTTYRIDDVVISSID